MPANSVTNSVQRRIQPSMNPSSDPSSGFVTVTSSWASTNSYLSSGMGRSQPPLAWSAVRHQVMEVDRDASEVVVSDRSSNQCSQAVLLTCLHLSHEMALRDVGLYAWTLPHAKDPSGSMIRIMKRYADLMQSLSTIATLTCRTAPDPSKSSIQRNLQKARLAAGPSSYVAVLYSGHGIQEPPTEAGELWCYDRSFEECAQQGGGPSEYIPILLFDLLTWAGASTCYVWDCQHAGRFIKAALTEAEEIDNQLQVAAEKNPSVASLHPAIYSQQQIHFAACGAHQIIPRVPGMPDDLFTCCLVTPLRIALLYHNLQTFPLNATYSGKYNQRSAGYMSALFENMSQGLKTRLWSELQAILHTIAWQSLGGKEYQMLFGQSGDVISNLAGGFLLSQRVMGSYKANPESIPPIPSSPAHPLWIHWDLILDNLFEQLPAYFDEDTDDWEKNLKLVSFMDDQLTSMLDIDEPYRPSRPSSFESTNIGHLVPNLARLPIVCKAALTPASRVQACTVLEKCLRNLDLDGLHHAIQGGALDVASQLLSCGDDSIIPQLISIWASLVRHNACVSTLAADGRTAERLTGLPSVQFFLDALERHLGTLDPESTRTVIQTAAVLSTIANYVAGRQAPRFVIRTLSLGSHMLNSDDSLVKQWGAMMAAEVMGSIDQATENNLGLVDKINNQLLDMIDSSIVENRATAVYALQRWIPSSPQLPTISVITIAELKQHLELEANITPLCQTDASALVREEVANSLCKVLAAGAKWTSMAIWVHALNVAVPSLSPEDKVKARELVAETSRQLGLKEEEKTVVKQLGGCLAALVGMRDDPNIKVGTVVERYLKAISSSANGDKAWTAAVGGIANEARSSGDTTPYDLQIFVDAKSHLLAGWNAPDPIRQPVFQSNNNLFERSKLSLQSYLAENTDSVRSAPDSINVHPESSREKTFILRYRSLEDSLVVSEQQVGLPWKWQVKDVESPEPWSAISFHSFLNLILACNKSAELSLWDWGTSKRLGGVTLDIPPLATVTSARFVNELFDRIIVVAEISNGDVHVLSASSDDPSRLKTISSFKALNRASNSSPIPTLQPLVSTWWRQSGKLCVGGDSDIVNVWDCPAERRDRALSTGTTASLTTIITEPVSGNVLLGGFANGLVKLWDLRQNRRDPLMSWQGDFSSSSTPAIAAGGSIVKLGVVLGESKHITSACSNRLLNIHDLRKPSETCSSVLVHADGIASASFQAHSGIMSTISPLQPSSSGASVALGLYRSTTRGTSCVSTDTLSFDSIPPGEGAFTRGYKPYTVIHNLRPYLGVGCGNRVYLRGAGVGSGEDTDSGSYSFLRSQGRYRS